MMETIVIISYILSALAICVREGIHNKDLANVSFPLRSKWKQVGVVIRAGITLTAYPDITLMLILAIILWIGYDIACAIGLKKPWWYIGTTSKIDGLGWLNYVLKGILIIMFIINLIY
jgi:hypothetical protein